MRKLTLFLLLALLLSACASAQAGEAPTTAAFLSPTASPAPSATPSPTQTPAPTLTPTLTATSTASPAAALSPTPTSPPITTLLFTGVIVPARCVQAALDANGNPDHPYMEVGETIQKADLAIGVFNATMSDNVVHTGCFTTYQLVGSPNNADALQRAGFDVMNVATNHIKDCGPMKSWCDSTFFDTLNNLQRVGIETVGAGSNLEQALQPLVVTVNGVRFGLVALGDSKLSEVVFATGANPGIARLNEENMRAAIAAARQVSDVVIAMPHWGSEDNLLPNWLQREQAQYIVDAGADLVVGNHTHVIQAYTRLNDIPVFYGLGNFVFDQDLRDHRQGAILLVRFEGTRFLDYELIYTLVDKDGRVHFTSPEESAQIQQRLDEANDLLD